MNTQTLSILDKIGIDAADDALAAAVEIVIIANPTATDAEITATVDGNLKHAARLSLGKRGWLVDFAWLFIESALKDAINAAIAQVRSAPLTGGTA